MNADPQSRIPRFSWYEIALIMLIPTVFVFAVWMAFPVWDDGWLVLLAAGVVLASLVTLVTRRPIKGAEEAEKQEIHSRIATVTLVAALAMGIVPIVIMGRVAIRTFESRFWLPILPIAACFTLYLLLSLLRPKVWAVVPALCGLLAGYYTASDAVRSISERRQTRGVGGR